MTAPFIALVTAAAARDVDDDLPPLLAALNARGAAVQAANWDDPAIDWRRFDLAVLRSTWDYSLRLDEFLTWADRAATQTRLLNPLDVGFPEFNLLSGAKHEDQLVNFRDF